MITKNVAVEFGRVVNGNKVDSCISITEATWWVYFINNTFYFIETSTLKQLIKDNEFRIGEGGAGERSRMYLIPLSLFLANAKAVKK